jgi:TnpA family transposase
MDRLFQTAYPQLKSCPTDHELHELYTPTTDDKALAVRYAKSSVINRLGLLLNLKLFQRLGYFVQLAQVPDRIKQHVAMACNVRRLPASSDWAQYDRSGTQRRHLDIVRAYCGVRVLDETGRTWLEGIAERTAQIKNNEADIINVMLEELVRERYELPGFTVLQRLARSARRRTDEVYYRQIIAPSTLATRRLIDDLFITPAGNYQSPWQTLKREPRKPTNREVRSYLQHVQRLQSLVEQLPAVELPIAKLKYFREVACAHDAAEMAKLTSTRRYALAIIFVRAQFSKTLDDTADLFIRLINNIAKHAQQRLHVYQLEQTKRVDVLIAQFKSLLIAYKDHRGSESALLDAIKRHLPDNVNPLIDECDEHLAYAGNNYLPFMLKPYQSSRSLLMNALHILPLQSTSADTLTERLIVSLKSLRHQRSEFIDLKSIGLSAAADLQWLSDKWRRLVLHKADNAITHVHRKYFEIAVMQYIKQELTSGDLAIRNSARYDDYREQFVDQDTFDAGIEQYGTEAGIATDASAFCAQLKQSLSEVAQRVDQSFPANTHASLHQGRLVLHRHSRSPLSLAMQRLDESLTQRLTPVNIVDVLTDTERWLNLHQQFGPLSGSEGRIDDPRMRFITTLFCYGCNLGPSQTSRAVKGLSRKQVAWLNLKQVTEDRLDKSIVSVINAYNQFELPRYWGSGKQAAADGTKWNLYEQNLISEYHIRYGGYGGIGYYLVSDKYIALFSHFIPCGVYEANYILDGLMANASDIQPDTVSGDTQAQNYPVFALSHLLGIQLMPRIRNIQDLTFFRPDKTTTYEHIDALFGESINWSLIEKHFPDMLRVALSIKLGKLTPSTILRRLGTASRKNKLYFAFRELGKVIRTIFLLGYIHDVEMRKTIHAATNKNEEFNGFAKWAFFGEEGIIAENIQHEQRKIVKYNQLVSNLVILYNVEQMTTVIKALQDEGMSISPELLAGLSPYRTAHINRFGDYTVNLDRKVPPPNFAATIL